jgi:hypothetical protein
VVVACTVVGVVVAGAVVVGTPVVGAEAEGEEDPQAARTTTERRPAVSTGRMVRRWVRPTGAMPAA